MADEDWQRLGDYVVARRIALGMRDRRSLAVATGVTERTLGKVETGRRVSASTLGALDNHLQWAPGSCRQVLAGAARGAGAPRCPAPAATSGTSGPMSRASSRPAGPDPPRAGCACPPPARRACA